MPCATTAIIPVWGLGFWGLGLELGVWGLGFIVLRVLFLGLIWLYGDVIRSIFGVYMALAGLYSFACLVRGFMGLSAGHNTITSHSSHRNTSNSNKAHYNNTAINLIPITTNVWRNIMHTATRANHTHSKRSL